MTVTIDERTDMVEDARQLIFEAIDLLKEAVRGLEDERYYEKTLIAGLEIMVGEGGWVSRDPTLDEIIEAIASEE